MLISEEILIMGCCCSNYIQQYDVVFKLPNKKEYLHYINGKFVLKNNINEWLNSIYEKEQFTDYIVYNDENNNKINGNCGHCKGIIAWNKTKISWLVHSVPNYPKTFDGKKLHPLPKSGLEFGQSFVFVNNISTEMLENIFLNLYSMHPSIYISTVNIPKQFKKYIKTIKFLKPLDITKNISHIAKTSNHNLDIYEYLAIYYKGNWTCRTWIRGNECSNSKCVKNNKLITHKTISYVNTKDHSKYACNNEYVIIGDLNRMTTQFDRGGGGIIIKDKNLAHQINILFGNIFLH